MKSPSCDGGSAACALPTNPDEVARNMRPDSSRNMGRHLKSRSEISACAMCGRREIGSLFVTAVADKYSGLSAKLRAMAIETGISARSDIIKVRSRDWKEGCKK